MEEKGDNTNNNTKEKKKKEKGDETTSSSGGDVLVASWGTFEDLLLASAVNRHGTASWDSISSEIGKHRRLISADACRHKYSDLKSRFPAGGTTEELIDNLRKLRVQQLKQEVHQHDLSILWLQEKVKTLEEEEREKNNNNSSSSRRLLVNSDLKIEADKTEEPAEKRDSTEEDRSVNESNSSKTEREVEDPKTSRLGELALPDAKQQNDDNNNKNNNSNNNKTKGMELELELQQQSSDVQSSASLSKKKRCRFRVGGVIINNNNNNTNSSGDELELEAEAYYCSVKSQPLIRFLELLREHKHASVFQRRLPTQETEKYRNVVRQHMDLDMVQSRLDRGLYSECHPKFYRDLILIFTNAVLFYRKSSAEHNAAREMRKLVMNEIILRTHKPKALPTKPDTEPPYVEPVVKKPRSSTTLVVCRRQNSMPGLSESMKRKEESHDITTSNDIKKSNNAIISKVGNGREEKAKDDELQKKVGGSSSSNSDTFASRKDRESGHEGVEVAKSKKFLTRERSNLGRGTLRLSNNNNKKIISKDGSKSDKIGNGINNNKEGDEPTEKMREIDNDEKKEKEKEKEKATTTILKKQGVANFLKRIKQNSPSSQEKAAISNDSDDNDEKDEVGRKEKTDRNGNKTGGITRKNKEVDVVVTRRSSGRKGEKEAAASSRSIGRPPKRKAAMMRGGTPDSAKAGKSGGGNARKKPRR